MSGIETAPSRRRPSGREQLQSSDRGREEVPAPRRDHPVDVCAYHLAMHDPILRESDRELPLALGPRHVVLANNQVVSGLQLLKVRIIHPLPQNKLKLLDDRGLVRQEDEPTLAKIQKGELA